MTDRQLLEHLLKELQELREENQSLRAQVDVIRDELCSAIVELVIDSSVKPSDPIKALTNLSNVKKPSS